VLYVIACLNVSHFSTTFWKSYQQFLTNRLYINRLQQYWNELNAKHKEARRTYSTLVYAYVLIVFHAHACTIFLYIWSSIHDGPVFSTPANWSFVFRWCVFRSGVFNRPVLCSVGGWSARRQRRSQSPRLSDQHLHGRLSAGRLPRQPRQRRWPRHRYEQQHLCAQRVSRDKPVVETMTDLHRTERWHREETHC